MDTREKEAIFSFCNGYINFLNKYVNTDARITFYGILFLIISISLFKVLYDVKEQTLNRPMYLVEEDNV